LNGKCPNSKFPGYLKGSIASTRIQSDQSKLFHPSQGICWKPWAQWRGIFIFHLICKSFIITHFLNIPISLSTKHIKAEWIWQGHKGPPFCLVNQVNHVCKCNKVKFWMLLHPWEVKPGGGCDSHRIVVLAPLRVFSLKSFSAQAFIPGGYPLEFLVGCAARISNFRPKKCHFPHPFSDLALNVNKP